MITPTCAICRIAEEDHRPPRGSGTMSAVAVLEGGAGADPDRMSHANSDMPERDAVIEHEGVLPLDRGLEDRGRRRSPS
jgi:hypothetical protein